MAIEVLPSLDLPVLFDDHHETVTTHTIPEATGMNRITTVLATVLSLAFTPLAAQENDCDGGISSDSEVKFLFWEAATVDAVSDCLNSGSHINGKAYDGTTLLQNAALLSRRPEVLKLLLDAGADVNARSDDGLTPLHAALINYKDPAILTVLLEAGADLNARNKDGFAPLHVAAALSENPVILTLLLDSGADLNATTEGGHTSLHYAARYNENPEVIMVLLSADADATVVNEGGFTPFDLVQDNEALVGTDAYWALNDARFE